MIGVKTINVSKGASVVANCCYKYILFIICITVIQKTTSTGDISVYMSVASRVTNWIDIR